MKIMYGFTIKKCNGELINNNNFNVFFLMYNFKNELSSCSDKLVTLKKDIDWCGE